MGRGKKWSESEIEYLDEWWGVRALSSLSICLGRTKKAIVIKAKRMKLGASTRADEYLTARQVAKILNVDSHVVLRWIEKHNLKVERRILLYKRRFFLIKHCDLLEWLESNQDKFDSRKIDLFNLGYEPEWLKEKKEKDKKLPQNRFKKWTTFDVQKIFNLAKNLKYREIAIIMGRSHDSIERKFGKLQYREKLLQKKDGVCQP
jgi:hypothetical protein